MTAETITRHELADLIELHAGLLAGTLRAQPPAPSVPGAVAAERSRRTPAVGDATAVGVEAPSVQSVSGSMNSWTKVGDLEGQTYAWPEGTEHYDPFEVWESGDARGRLQLGLGNAVERGTYYGKDRGYWLVFDMVNGQKRRPIVVFTESDDYEQTGDLVAVIKGKGAGGRSMFNPSDDLPAGYERLRVELFRDRISGPQAYNRLAVIAEGGDRQAMLDHGLMQLRLRS
jgi:hypothetical protein